MGTASLQFALKMKMAPLLFSENDAWEGNVHFALIHTNCWLTEMLLSPRLITTQNLSSSPLWQYQAGTLADLAVPWPDWQPLGLGLK